MNTAKKWGAAVASAGLAFTMFFTGCGGGGDSGPQTVAPSSLVTRSYVFSPNTGGQTAVTFATASNYSYQHETGAIEQGTYTASQSGDVWNVTLNNDNGGQQVFTMSFSSGSAGNFRLHREGETDRTGPFSQTTSALSNGSSTSGSNSGATTDGSTTTGATTSGSTTSSSTTGATSTSSNTGSSTSTGTTSGTTTSGGNPNPSTTSGPPGPPGPGTTTGTTSGSTTTSTTAGTTSGTSTTGSGTSTAYNGFAPVSIVGRTMYGTRTFTSTGTSGQTHTYTFSNGTFHDSDSPEEADGTYTYTAGNSSATLTLNYTAPSTFVGDKHQISMTFTAKDNGNFQSTYTRGDGTEITINGNFEFVPIQ